MRHRDASSMSFLSVAVEGHQTVLSSIARIERLKVARRAASLDVQPRVRLARVRSNPVCAMASLTPFPSQQSLLYSCTYEFRLWLHLHEYHELFLEAHDD